MGSAQCTDREQVPAGPLSAAARAAGVCLLALAVAVPLTPVSETSVAGKQIVFLALASLGMLLVWCDALRREPRFESITLDT